MIKLILLITILLFACQTPRIEVTKLPIGKWKEDGKSFEYEFLGSGKLKRNPAFDSPVYWEIDETYFNQSVQGYIIFRNEDGLLIESYLPFWRGEKCDTLDLNGLLGDRKRLVKI